MISTEIVSSMWKQVPTNLPASFNLPSPELRGFLQRNVTGYSENIRTPFWQKRNPLQVLQAWQQVIDATSIKHDYPTLYAFEMDMKSKVGPMSIQLPLKDRMQDIENYYTLVQLKSEPIETNAVQAAGEYFSGINGLRPRSVAETVDNMKLSTQAGCPYYGKKRNVVDKVVKMLDPNSMKILTNYILVAILSWRGQEGGPSIDDIKQRVIWMLAFPLQIRELQVYQPFVAAAQKSGVVPAWISNDAVDKAITQTWKWKDPESVVICTDFKKFDQHFNQHMSDCALSLLKGMFTPSTGFEEWTKTIFPQKYNIPLVCSEKITFTGQHGMASGSGGTNQDETLTHKALQFEAAQSIGAELCPFSQCLGDDGYLVTNGKLTVDQIVKVYSRHGQEMNVEKQYASAHDLTFLRRWHSDSYVKNGVMVGVYPTFRALGRLLYQERYYDPSLWGPKMVTLRAWSILENCEHHPSFEEFVDFVIKGDKYRLGLSIPGFIDGVDQLAKEATDLMPDFLGYNQTQMSEKKGIKEWRIYKYLKSKA